MNILTLLGSQSGQQAKTYNKERALFVVIWGLIVISYGVGLAMLGHVSGVFTLLMFVISGLLTLISGVAFLLHLRGVRD